MVPHLLTALTGPINELEQRVLDAMPAIERWFRLEWMEHTPPFYSAVDLRNAGFKLAPVETDLFPGGWNHLSRETLPLAVQAAMAAIEKICPEARNLLIVPANDPQDSAYLANLAQLQRIFNRAGLHVRVGSISPEICQPTRIALPDGDSVMLEPALRSKRRLGLQDFDPCTILLNNDLPAGAPGILEDLHEQYLLPPLHAGSSVRRKSNHCKNYEEVAKRFGKLLGIDHWLLCPLYSACAAVDWDGGQGFDRLQASVEVLLGKLRRKHKEYGIKDKPFVIVKANQGSDGPGSITVRELKDLDSAHAAQRKRGKKECGGCGLPAGELIVQEGLATQERLRDAAAEPVVYMMDRYVVGGFYRAHAQRGSDQSLDAPGARCVPLAFEHNAFMPHTPQPGASAPNRFYMYGVVARLAMLAASYELEATDPLAEVYD